MKVVFETQHGEKASVDVPFHVSEITFADFCDFRTAERVLWDSMREDEPNAENQALSILNLIRTVVSGDVEKLPFTFIDDNADQLMRDNFTISVGSDISIIRLYAHIVNMVNGFEPKVPKRYRLKWKGERYEIDQQRGARLLLSHTVTVGEAIELLEFQRRSVLHKEKNPSQAGNIDFTLGLTEFSILMRKKGERFPSERAEIDAFLDERRTIFADLPMSDVLTARFFLLTSLLVYAKSQSIRSSGKVREKRQAVVRKLKKKPRRGPKLPGKS